MRIIFLFLLVGLCLVSAKYIPQESSATNLVQHRVRRSDSDDADSNAASVERDDDSSNDNDNNDDDDNDSSEKKLIEEQNKLREKEEKKKKKVLERLEKERQKEIEEKRKLEEHLLKEQRRQQEKQEKEERKIHERIEKERRKAEEQKRKLEEKAEKEERKRQEKLRKQLEEIEKEQVKSAEDRYLETEEEDSVEIEDIWKAHVYNKYGLSVTSTKLERQAALQRYLREELGIDANSTKSERRQAIIKLIQTKLHNDSATVDAFRNLLLSHVNAAQIQKMRSKLENDLEELNNKTEMLNNISLPWVSVAQQNIEEKRTFLQAVVQFLSNTVPNWFAGGQDSNNPIQANSTVDSSFSVNTEANGINNVNVALPAGSGQSSITPSESNLSTGLNSQNNSGDSVNQSSNKPGQSATSSDNISINNNTGVDSSNTNEVSSNVDILANSESLNNSSPAGSEQASSNPSESSASVDNGSLHNNAGISSTDQNGMSGNAVTSDNSGSSVVASQPNLPTDNSQNNNGSSGDVNELINNGVALPDSVSSNDVFQNGSDQSLNNPTQSELSAVTGPSLESTNGEHDVNGLPSNGPTSLNSDSFNVATPTDSIQSTINPGQSVMSGANVPVNSNTDIGVSDVDGLSTNTDTSISASPESPNVASATDSEQTSNNPLQSSGTMDNGFLNNNGANSQANPNEVSSNAVISGNPESSDFASSGDTQQSSNNPAESSVSPVADNSSLNNEPAFGQADVSVLPNVVAVSPNVESANTNTPTVTDQASTNPIEPNIVDNNVLTDSVLNNSSYNKLPETVDLPNAESSHVALASGIEQPTNSETLSSTVGDQLSSNITVVGTALDESGTSVSPSADVPSNISPSGNDTNAVSESNSATIGNIQPGLQGNSAPVEGNNVTTGTAEATVSNGPTLVETTDSSLIASNIVSVTNSDAASTDSTSINTSNNITISNINEENIPVAHITSSSSTDSIVDENLEQNGSTQSAVEVDGSHALGSSGTVETVKETNSGIENVSAVSASDSNVVTTNPNSEVLGTTLTSLPDVSVPSGTETGSENTATLHLPSASNTDNIVNYVTGTSVSLVPETSQTNETSADSSVATSSNDGTVNTEGNSSINRLTESTVAVTSSAATASDPVTLNPVAVDQSTVIEDAPVVKSIDSATPVEAQPEKDTNIVQESVNTPADSATVPSVVMSVQTDVPIDITVPVEPGASIVDIKAQ